MVQRQTEMLLLKSSASRGVRAIRSAVTAFALFALGGGIVAACDSTPERTLNNNEEEPPPQEFTQQTCEAVGGVWKNNACEGKCTPDKCLAENTCVDNRCVLKCDAHTDCKADASQNCTPAKEDDTGADIAICTAHDVPAGMGIKCPNGTECAQVGVCPDGTGCNLAMCGGNPAACIRDDAACGTDMNCTIGKCTSDGAACKINTCAPADCKPLKCLTTGEGDADAYCTLPECSTDADCLGGMYCGLLRLPNELCGSNPVKGNNGLCGKTMDPCIAAISLDPDSSGKTFEGSMCILQRTCLKRSQCAPCSSDLDCSQFDAQKCIQIGGESRCARACNASKDCDPDYMCTDGSCVPRFGACKGQGNFCEPCQSDEDCGDSSTRKACIEGSGGQRACFDYSWFGATCDPMTGCKTCVTDADCPLSPGGLNGVCLNENLGVNVGDPEYQRCYLPYNANENKFGCW